MPTFSNPVLHSDDPLIEFPSENISMSDDNQKPNDFENADRATIEPIANDVDRAPIEPISNDVDRAPDVAKGKVSQSSSETEEAESSSETSTTESTTYSGSSSSSSSS
jgi:hypothetical protein